MRSGCLSLCLALAVAASVPRPADARKCPNVLFVVDTSGSMLELLNGKPPNKWILAKTAIASALQKYGSRIPFGLELFGSRGGVLQCYSDTAINVLPGHGQASYINNVLNRYTVDPNAGTNTGEAIKRAYTDGKLDDPARGNYIVLVTDGDPNCDRGDNMTATYTVSEITNATKKNPTIHTFVVGFEGQGEVNPDNLNAMAQAGLEPRDGCNPKDPHKPCYYSATTSQQFLEAMDVIVAGLLNTSVIGGCDDSCFGQGCPKDQICRYPMPNVDPVCTPDPCLNLSCGPGQYCKAGACINTCPYCAAGTYCSAGVCVADKCDGASFDPATQFCDHINSGVQTNKCISMQPNCPLPTFCDPHGGLCIDDPCRLVNCPPKSTCNADGWCMTDPPDGPDMQVLPDLKRASVDLGASADTGSSGCRLRGRQGVGAGSLLPLLALVVLGLRRRFRR